MEKHILAGRTINALYVSKDGLALKFDTDQGEVLARCDADCCSSTWVEHVETPFNGFPAKVASAEDVPLNIPDKEEDYEVTRFYGFKIATDNGEINIDYRNSSNGYYGGNLSWPGEYFYGGVFEQNVPREPIEWVPADEYKR